MQWIYHEDANTFECVACGFKITKDEIIAMQPYRCYCGVIPLKALLRYLMDRNSP